MRGWARTWVVCAVVLLAWTGVAHATAGDLDPGFSGDGRVTVVPPSDGTFVARALALQPDGRIVVAGFSCAPVAGGDGTCLGGGGSSVRLARLTPDGGLDAEFGNGGFVTTPIGSRSQAFDVLRLEDGSLVVAGLARTGDRDVLALAKYTPAGRLDGGFGSGGIVTQAVGSGFAAGAALAAGPGGTLYVAGQAVDGGGARRMVVARFGPSGVLDGGWGSGGLAFAGPAYGYALGLTFVGDGPLVAGVGGASDDPAGYRFGLARLQAGGAPDPVFGRDGSATFAPGNGQVASFANAVAPSGGGWIAAGAATGADNAQAMALLRGDASGALDPGFGTGGQVLVSAGQGAVANDVVVAPDGRVIAIGQARTGTGYAFATARLTPAGALDPAFSGGVTTIGFDLPATRATAGAVQPDGKLVTAGIGCSGSVAADCAGGTSVLVVARQLADPPPPPAPPPPSGPATPTTPAQPAKPRVRVAGFAKRISRRSLQRSGVRVRVKTSVKVRAKAWLAGARRSGSHKPFRLVQGGTRRWQRSFTVRLRPKARAVRRTRSGRLRLGLAVRTAAGARVTRTFTIRLR